VPHIGAVEGDDQGRGAGDLRAPAGEAIVGVDKIEALRDLLFVTFQWKFAPHWLGRPNVTAVTISRLTHQKGIALIVWSSLVVGTVDNIVRPLVLGSRVELHPLLLLFALLGGVQVFGFIGIFVGPMVISVIAPLVEMLRDELASAYRDASPVPNTLP
jgi:hypothetical protein